MCTAIWKLEKRSCLSARVHGHIMTGDVPRGSETDADMSVEGYGSSKLNKAVIRTKCMCPST